MGLLILPIIHASAIRASIPIDIAYHYVYTESCMVETGKIIFPNLADIALPRPQFSSNFLLYSTLFTYFLSSVRVLRFLRFLARLTLLLPYYPRAEGGGVLKCLRRHRYVGGDRVLLGCGDRGGERSEFWMVGDGERHVDTGRGVVWCVWWPAWLCACGRVGGGLERGGG